MSVYCIVNQTMRLSQATPRLTLKEPLAYTNKRAHAMRVTVLAEGSNEPADLTGVSCTGTFLRMGTGEAITPLTGTVDTTNGICDVVLPASCYAVPGRFRFTMDLACEDRSDSVDGILDAYGDLNMSQVEAGNATIGSAMNAVFSAGNVDLLNRPEVDAADLVSAGYTDAGTGTATVYSVEYYMGQGSSVDYAFPENLVLHLTPIKADGTIVSLTNLEAYINNTLKTQPNIGAMVSRDKPANGGYGLILYAQPVKTTWQAAYDIAGDFDEYLHLMQAAYYLAETDDMPTEADLRSMYTAVWGDSMIANRTALWVEGIVEANTSDTIVDPGTSVTNYTTIIANANAAAAAAEAAVAELRQLLAQMGNQ